MKAISRLDDTPSALAVYASSRGCPFRCKTRFRLVVSLCRAGQSPAGFRTRFRIVLVVYISASLTAPRGALYIRFNSKDAQDNRSIRFDTLSIQNHGRISGIFEMVKGVKGGERARWAFTTS